MKSSMGMVSGALLMLSTREMHPGTAHCQNHQFQLQWSDPMIDSPPHPWG
jgi:hypothetical protein